MGLCYSRPSKGMQTLSCVFIIINNPMRASPRLWEQGVHLRSFTRTHSPPLLPMAPPDPSVGAVCPRLPPPEHPSQAAVSTEVHICGSPSSCTPHPEPAWWTPDGSLVHKGGGGGGEDTSGQWPHLEAGGDSFGFWLVFPWEPPRCARAGWRF